MTKSNRAALLLIFAVSFGLLVNEIMLSAIFHVLLGAGNTVAAIAIALVGLSASGIFAYTFPVFHDPERSEEVSRALLFWFTLSLILSTYFIMAIPISHGDLIYYGGQASVKLWKLAVYHISVAPFFLGGLLIAVFFRSGASQIGRLYFADLLGAALGCIASPLFLAWFGAPGAILAAAIPCLLLSMSQQARRPGWRRALALLPALLLAIGLVRPQSLSFATINTMGEVENATYRSFPIRAGDIEYERWALDAWTIIRSDRIPQQWENFRGWGLSPLYDGPIPETRLVNYNARFSTYVTSRAGDPEALGEWLDADISSLHHLIGRNYDEVLNIGAGGGRETLAALHHGAKHVTSVDVSDVVIEDVMKRYLVDFSGGLYLDPRVDAIADEGRSFTERSSRQFDLVEFSIVGGMNLEKMDLVRVDDLFTLEALRTYLGRLNEDGVFSYVMYSTRSDILEELRNEKGMPPQPYIPALRTLTGLRQALENAEPGRRFSDHVLMAALPGVINPRYDLVHILVSRSPFSESEKLRFVETTGRLGFTLLHPLPEGPAQPQGLYAQIASESDLTALAAVVAFSIWPATDDRPFQYALDLVHLRRALEHGGLFELIAGNPLVSLGVSIGSLAALLTLAPLLIGSRRADSLAAFRSHWPMLLYFACIGFAYMAVEIAALLRLQSFLGKPIYGLSVGLFAFLLASGLGSNLTSRFEDARLENSVRKIVLGLVGVGILFVLGSAPLFASTIALPLPTRIAIAVAAILPLAYLMGMLFPIGIRLIARSDADLIPWAWATNGCFSVLGIFGTRITALLFGFSRGLVIGLVVYLLVMACVAAGARSDRRAAAE
jgi:SAM-dependent methyltransferase